MLYAWRRIPRVPPPSRPWRDVPQDELVAHAAELAAAAEDYRRTARALMERLAVAVDLPLSAFWERLVRVEVAQLGRLDREWLYFFHGHECCFGQQRTGQMVDVPLGYVDEFGVLDPQFFAGFVTTTARWAPLVPLCHDHHSARRAIEVLNDHGYLREIPGSSMQPAGLASRGSASRESG